MSQTNVPDFAFPQTVSADAQADLAKALKAGDAEATVDALIRYGLAETMISNDNFIPVIAKVETIADSSNNPTTKALLRLLLGDLYRAYYETNQYNINRRTTLTDPGSDISLWSGDNFKDKITSLCIEASSDTSLQAIPISDFDEIITADATTRLFYPTLYDFACIHAIGILEALGNSSSAISTSRISDLSPIKISVKAPVTAAMFDIINSWVEANPRPTAARIATLLARTRAIIDNSAVTSDATPEVVALYKANSSTPYAMELLLETNVNDDSDAVLDSANDRFYDIYKSFAEANPDYFRIDAVKNILEQYTRKSAQVIVGRYVGKGVPFTISISGRNVNAGSIAIYRVSPTDKSGAYLNSNAEKVAVVPFKVEGTAPFSYKTSVQASIDQYGCYIIVPQFEGADIERQFDIVRCSDIGFIDTSDNSSALFFTVNSATGAPIGGADITLTENSRKPRITTATTDKQGIAKFDVPFSSSYAAITKGEDKYLGQEWFSKYANRSVKEQINAAVRTSLPIYHPGDALDFVAIVYKVAPKERQPLAGRKVMATLRSPNNEILDTIFGTTDSMGRFAESFEIPTDGITGYFGINIWMLKDGAADEESNYTYVSAHSISVSDYKLPTYTLTANVEANGDIATNGVTVVGEALTYSGFPVADADISLVLNNYAGFFNSQRVELLTLTDKTDADGKFAIYISPEIIASAPYNHGYFTAQLTSTSTAGENREATAYFTLSKSHYISTNVPAINLAKGNASWDISVNKLNGDATDADLTLTFAKDGFSKEIATRTVGGKCTVDLNAIPSGSYSLTISADDCDSVEQDIIIYRTNDKQSPVAGEPLWIPQTKITATKGKAAEALFASDYDDSYVAMIVYVDNAITEYKWVKAHRGMNTLKINVPDGASTFYVKLASIHNFKSSDYTLTISVVDPNDGLKLSIESFRDKVIPQTQETLTFKTTDNSATGKYAALILNGYNKALTAIQLMPGFSFAKYSTYLPSLDTIDFLNVYSTVNSAITDYPYSASVETPGFNTYGYSFGIADDYDNFIGVRLFSRSSPYATKNLAYNEAIGEYDEASIDTDAGSLEAINTEKAEASDVDYRQSEVPLALFAPTLETDAEGNLSYSFTVPNANTTWVLDAIAYNSELDCSQLSREIIASKPVMVQPNLPRFLRLGDKATLLCTVMNNSDANGAITTVIEITDPATGEVINRVESTDEVAAGASTIVSADIASTDANSLLITVRASLGIYTDGERSLLPILSDSQQVIDSQTFYLGNDEKTLTVNLDPTAEDASTVLTFCQNPTWEVVTALPGLLETESTSSIAQAARIFSAAVAAGLMRDNPTVAADLKQWLETADASELTSMLNKNEDLKQLMLASTPWVGAAASDTERMTRLSLLFNNEAVNKAINDAICKLLKLECSTGGWAWTGYFDVDVASEWSTYTVLNTLGELRKLGYLPNDADLERMIKEAVKYIDTEVAKDYAKYPGNDYTLYTYTRSLYDYPYANTTAEKVVNDIEQRIVKNWRKHSVDGKAIDVLIINKRYPAVARQILASIRQFASSSKQQGMWWDAVQGGSWWSMERNGRTAIILRAFTEVEPRCDDIDMIRQWLILNKQVQDWGTSVSTTECIAGILGCGSQWLTEPSGLTIDVDGAPLSFNVADRLTGSFVADIKTNAANITVNRTANGPAWGSVINRYRDKMVNIEAHSVEGLSIEKQTLVRRGESYVAGDELQLGDVVKVRLIINSARDMDYITIVDNRAACFEPSIQTPRYVYCDGLRFYLENRDASTNLFINRLHKGQFIIEYEMNVNNAGIYSSGVATVQSQYTPEMTAHSAGTALTVTRQTDK